jgi:hypothetical protein
LSDGGASCPSAWGSSNNIDAARATITVKIIAPFSFVILVVVKKASFILFFNNEALIADSHEISIYLSFWASVLSLIHLGFFAIS